MTQLTRAGKAAAFTCRALQSLCPEEEKCDFQVRAQTGFVYWLVAHPIILLYCREWPESHISNMGQSVLGKPVGGTDMGTIGPISCFPRKLHLGGMVEGGWGKKIYAFHNQSV